MLVNARTFQKLWDFKRRLDFSDTPQVQFNAMELCDRSSLVPISNKEKQNESMGGVSVFCDLPQIKDVVSTTPIG